MSLSPFSATSIKESTTIDSQQISQYAYSLDENFRMNMKQHYFPVFGKIKNFSANTFVLCYYVAIMKVRAANKPTHQCHYMSIGFY